MNIWNQYIESYSVPVFFVIFSYVSHSSDRSLNNFPLKAISLWVLNFFFFSLFSLLKVFLRMIYHHEGFFLENNKKEGKASKQTN